MSAYYELFEYAVVLQPRYDHDGNEMEKAELVVKPTTVLASSETDARLLAGRDIPTEYLDRLERMATLVRPFAR